MKKTLLFILCSFFALALAAKSVTPAALLPEYYEMIDGKSGKSLFDAVHEVAKVGYSSLSYSGLWTAFGKTDLRENGLIWDIYSDCEFEFQTDQDNVPTITANTLYQNRGLEDLRVAIHQVLIFFTCIQRARM